MPSTEVSRETVESVLFDALAHLGPDRSEIRLDATFEELDIDSLDLVELSQVVDRTWGIEFDPEDFANVTTVGEALDLVLARMS